MEVDVGFKGRVEEVNGWVWAVGSTVVRGISAQHQQEQEGQDEEGHEDGKDGNL